MANGLVDPVYHLRPNKIDAIRRSWDPAGLIGSMVVQQGNLSISGKAIALRRVLLTITRGHITVSGKTQRLDRRKIFTPGHLTTHGKSVPLGQGVSWLTIPSFGVDRDTAFPKYINGIRANYLVDPGARVTSVTVEDVDLGVITYEDKPADRLVIASDPGPNPDAIKMRAHVLTGSTTAQADWVARSTGPGVVWAHDFRYQAEVDNFRWPNNPASTENALQWVQNDGLASGKCISIAVPTGGQADDGWWRPFSALQAGINGNGQPTPDAAANGTITRRTDWNAGSLSYPASAAVAQAWRGGMYTHNAYNPNFGGSSATSPGAPASEYDCLSGGDFYVQFRCKIQGSRFQGLDGNPDGKLAFVGTTKASNPNQELVVQSTGYWGNSTAPFDAGGNPENTAPFRMYTNNGHNSNSILTDPQGSGSPGYIQPGSIYTTCNVTSPRPLHCWYWPKDQWVTVMIHVKPGRNPIDASGDWLNNSVNFPRRDTAIDAYVALPGQTVYTLLYSKNDYAWQFGGATSSAYPDDLPEGFNAFQPSAFMNSGPVGANALVGWFQRYTEIIFSRLPIACPQV